MSSRKLTRISGIEQNIIEKLAKHKITTCRDLLSRNHLQLLEITGLTYHQVNDIVKIVSKCVVPKQKSALFIKQSYCKEKPFFLTTSLPQLDHALHGGLPSMTIIEITGPPGCGKTQFCILLTIITTLSENHGGLNGGVVYIDTEAAFTAQRLIEMALSRFPYIFTNKEKQKELLSNVHVFLESTCSALLHRLQSLECDIISNNIRLIIVDSIASLVRKEFDIRTAANTNERTALLTKEATILKYIAERFEIPVVVTNQITTVVSHDKTQKINDIGNETAHITAALGNTWAHAINTRLTLQYIGNHQRQIMITKSPLAAFKTFRYTVQAEGIVLEDSLTEDEESKESFNLLQQRLKGRSSV